MNLLAEYEYWNGYSYPLQVTFNCDGEGTLKDNWGYTLFEFDIPYELENFLEDGCY